MLYIFFMLASCIIGPTLKEALFQIDEAMTLSDLLEVRFDLIDKKYWEKIVNHIPISWIAKGGGWHFQPNYVDIEWDAPEPDTNAEIIRSFHDFEKTPKDLNKLFEKMKKFPAKYYKIASYAKSANDAMRLLSLMQKNRGKLIAIAMGERGQFSRAMGRAAGSPVTYAASHKKYLAAPGQITAQDLVTIYRFSEQRQITRFFGLIGEPIDKSQGHIYHNNQFRQKDGLYVKIPLKANELKKFFSYARELNFQGLSVTMPLKEKVIPFLKNYSGASVNTIVWTDHQMVGYNTDALGAIEVLEKKFPKKAVVLGAGGTAKAISEALHKKGVFVTLLNRTLNKAKEFAIRLGMEYGLLSDLSKLDYDLLVQATSCGMNKDQMPVCPSAIRSRCTVLEVIAKKTRFIQEAKLKQCHIIEGGKLFIAQAKHQQKIWGF